MRTHAEALFIGHVCNLLVFLTCFDFKRKNKYIKLFQFFFIVTLFHLSTIIKVYHRCNPPQHCLGLPIISDDVRTHE